MPPTIRIVRPSSREASDLLTPRLEELRDAGFEVRYEDIQRDLTWTYTAGSASDRAAALQTAIAEVDTSIIWAARGGYGASDLLPLLDWPTLAASPEKILIGFSDISAIHAAFYTKLGWRGWHAPMPATSLWRQNSIADIEQLTSLIHNWQSGQKVAGEIPLIRVSQRPTEHVQGRLFGGCFSVLTGLIGTPYFPRSLKDHIVFIEDVDESPARLMRALNQWLQAGALQGVSGLVVGSLKDLGGNIPDNAPYVLQEIARRVEPIPVFHSPLFGHVSPNFVLPLGADATLTSQLLTWRLTRKERTRLA